MKRSSSFVLLGEQLRALSKSRLGRYRGELRPSRLEEVERAMAIALGLTLAPRQSS